MLMRVRINCLMTLPRKSIQRDEVQGGGDERKEILEDFDLKKVPLKTQRENLGGQGKARKLGEGAL